MGASSSTPQPAQSGGVTTTTVQAPPSAVASPAASASQPVTSTGTPGIPGAKTPEPINSNRATGSIAAGSGDAKADAKAADEARTAQIIAKYKLTKEIVDPIRALFQRYDKEYVFIASPHSFLPIH